MPIPKLTVCREFSAERINVIANHPGVRSWIGGNGALDLTPLIIDPRNVLLMGLSGGVLFQWLEPGLYEAHTQFLPEARGKESIQNVRDALRWMFARSDAVEIVTKVPLGNLAALGLVRVIHGQKLFEREAALLIDGNMQSVAFYGLSIMSWAGSASGIAESGHWFHEKLETAKAATAGAAPLHPDDAAHDQYVGAAVEMIAAGQVAKGIAFYNRWAVVSGYGPIAIIAQDPIVIDIGDALLAVRGDDFDVLLCR